MRAVTLHTGYWEIYWLRPQLVSESLYLVQLHCVLAQLVECSAPRCVAARSVLDRLIPACETWPNFRRWVLFASSCQLAACSAGFKWLESFSSISLRQCMLYLPDDSVLSDPIFEVLEILYFWDEQVERRIRSRVGDNYYFDLGIYSHGPELGPFIQRSTKGALETAHKVGICVKRLWDLAYMTPRAHRDLRPLMEVVKTALSPRSFEHRGHDVCTPEFCEFADENSTLKTQLHKCADADCGSVQFPVEGLADVVIAGRQVAWKVTENYNPVLLDVTPPQNAKMSGGKMPSGVESNAFAPSSEPGEHYIAISHVWSDGTGVGVRPAGEVNSCLVSYFFDIAHKLGCKGLWWDTVCIPLEKKARSIAINNMHENYSEAKHTVVHDEYLVRIDWADDGSPALALVLSPWFTRGWTALELSLSNSVKVIYRDPNDHTKQVLKDLDKDILAIGISRPGHSVASRLIESLRGKPGSLLDLLTILSVRTTSWSRDRIAIAGLLARSKDVDYNDTRLLATGKIISSYRTIEQTLLHHGHTTLIDKGPLSWCPANLLWGTQELWNHRSSSMPAHVDQHQAVLSHWQLRTLDAELAKTVRPSVRHLSVEARIIQVLEENLDSCVILQADNSNADYSAPDLPDILAVTTGLWSENEEDPYIDCHYIGCVADDSYDRSSSRYQKFPFRLGCDREKPPLPAKECIECLEEVRPGSVEVEFLN